jgi:hypothetical protein
MGILDDAIRDHLELKRKGGAREADLRRLESEAFGPSSRPGDVAPGATATVEPPKTSTESPQPEDVTQIVPEQSPAPEPTAPAASESSELAPEPAPEGGPVFHDFAAEEGLVAPLSEVAAEPTSAEPEPAEPEPARPEAAEPEVTEEAAEPAPPAEAPGVDDTQSHDMQSELGAAEQPEEAPVGGLGAEEIDLEEELELELDEEDLGVAPEPNLTVVEEDVEVVDDEPAEEAGAIEEQPSEAGDEGEQGDEIEEAGEDVLEETPEFLRETPEHDRLWFEQKPPKDFDFDE